MEFITGPDLIDWLGEQIGLWDAGDIVFALINLPSLHAYLNAQTFFELDTSEADQHIEHWLNSEILLCSAFEDMF